MIKWHHLEWLGLKRLKTPIVDDGEELEFSYSWWICTLKNSLRIYLKIQNMSITWASHPLIDVYPREIKINVPKNSYTQMFIATLLKYPQIRKQCMYPSRSE